MARRLLFLNGLATFGLVLNHASSWVFIAMFWWTDRYRDVAVPDFEQIGSASYYVLRVVEQAVAFTVPSFLFVSGFFVAFVVGREPLWARWAGTTQRLRTLLPPYVLWSTVLLLERFLQGQRYSARGYLAIYLTGRAAEPYYFIPLLCQCLLLSPLLITWARKNWKSLLFLAAVLQLAVQSARYATALETSWPWLRALLAATPSWFFPGKIFWFTWGLVVGLRLDGFQKGVARRKQLLVWAAMVLLALGIVEWELLMELSPAPWIAYFDTALDGLYAAAIIMVVIAFGAPRSPQAERVEEIGRHSYGVYLVHTVVLSYAARGIFHAAPHLLGQSVLMLVFLFAMGLGVPLAAMSVVRHSRWRSAYRYVFG